MNDAGYRGSFSLELLNGLDARISHVERVVNKAATVAEAMFDDQRDRNILVHLAGCMISDTRTPPWRRGSTFGDPSNLGKGLTLLF